MTTSDYIIMTFIGLLILIPILIGYFMDYKRNPKEFDNSLQAVLKGVAKFLIVFILVFCISKLLIPFNKNHGVEYNAEREKIGIPEIEKGWTKDKGQSEQFQTYWWKPEPIEGHFKKVIEYGIFGLESETDYYKNKNLKGTFAWSKYSFESNKFEYFLEKPNENLVSVTKSGQLKAENPTLINRISKKDFEKYILQ